VYLPTLVEKIGDGNGAEAIAQMSKAGVSVPEILYDFAYKTHTRLLCQFTQEVMRGPSDLTPGQRELIAAMTSAENACRF